MTPQLADFVAKVFFYVVLPLLIAFITHQLKTLILTLKTKNPALFYDLTDMATKAVHAAEQMHASGQIEADARKSYALKVLQGWVDLHGWPVNVDLLESLIEAAVFDALPKV